MNNHDFAYAYQHGVVELLLNDLNVAILGNTCQSDAQKLFVVQISLAVDFHVLIVSKDDFGDYFSLIWFFCNILLNNVPL